MYVSSLAILRIIGIRVLLDLIQSRRRDQFGWMDGRWSFLVLERLCRKDGTDLQKFSRANF